jgi:hypothetical protein
VLVLAEFVQREGSSIEHGTASMKLVYQKGRASLGMLYNEWLAVTRASSAPLGLLATWLHSEYSASFSQVMCVKG